MFQMNWFSLLYWVGTYVPAHTDKSFGNQAYAFPYCIPVQPQGSQKQSRWIRTDQRTADDVLQHLGRKEYATIWNAAVVGLIVLKISWRCLHTKVKFGEKKFIPWTRATPATDHLTVSSTSTISLFLTGLQAPLFPKLNLKLRVRSGRVEAAKNHIWVFFWSSTLK